LKEFLKSKIGEKLGITRFGMPVEIYFEAKLKSIDGEVALFENERGQIFALGIDRVILVGPPEKQKDDEKSKPGFTRTKESGKA
jgi:hypothetical protein